MTFNEFMEQIKKYEGFVDHTYTDAGGTLTIGYGFTQKQYTSRLTMIRKEADEILEKLLKDTYASVKNKCISWGYVFTEEQLLALTSFTYNLGISNLSMLTKNGKRTPTEIANKISEYCHCNGKVLKGLVTRRQWEQSLFVGQYTSKDIQNLCNDIIDTMELNLEKLVVDGKIGNKSIQCIGTILSLVR